MTARPTIVVSLPARTVAEATGQRDLARRAGADAAEIRFDRWSPMERAQADALFPTDLPLVATFRSTHQGGGGPDRPEERRAVLERLGELPFRWIDLELGRDSPEALRLPDPGRLGRIVSCHLRGDEYAAWVERLDDLEAVDGIGKLVVPASVPQALGEILPRLSGRHDASVVVLTTGPSGPLLRALSRRVGAPLVYAALPAGAGVDPVEPSQIPVDRLRPYLDADGAPPIFAVVGRPVAHSSSPAVHCAWMRSERRAGLYVALEFATDAELLDSVPMLAAVGVRGLNVTQPFKEVAFAAATDADPSAAACGAANCLTFDDGSVRASNTDLAAILRRLEELRRSGAWDGRCLTVLGAGGAARATLAAARELGIPSSVHARRPEAAAALAEVFRASTGPARPGSLVVHATSAGRNVGEPLDPSLDALLAESAGVVDWVYRPADPIVRDRARAHGTPYEDGWRLFVYQAAASYGLWWGEPPPADRIDRTIEEGPCTG